MDPEVPGSSPGGGTTLPHLRSAHARYAQYAAAANGYGFRSLDGEDGYLFEICVGARVAVFAAGSGTPYALNDARAASLARDKAFCAEVLRAQGLPVVPGRMFFVTERWSEMRGPGREPCDALAFAAQAEYPLFCKPIDGSNGLHAEVVADAANFADYLRRVSRDHFAMLAQPYVHGDEFRVFVLEGRPLFSYRKRPPTVIGDGKLTLRTLVERLKRDNGPPLQWTRARDRHGALMGLEVVPRRGQRVHLEGPANRAAGGGATDLRDGAAEPLSMLACAAAETIGLRLAGVDIFDVSPLRDLSELLVIEVNSNPMIQTLEEGDRWDLIAQIWRTNIQAALR